MALWINDEILDFILELIRAGLPYDTRISACSQQPTTFTEARETYMLAEKVIDLSSVTKADGDVSGRKMAIPEVVDAPITSSGVATHVALTAYYNGTYTDAKLVYVTTCDDLTLVAGGTITFPTWDIEVADPTLPA
jgi:hypothetical protein